jgi:geranylgeranyl pyrophosphate synthase
MKAPAPVAPEPAEPPLEVLIGQTLGREATQELIDLVPVLADDLHHIDRRIDEVLRAQYPQLTDSARYACRAGGKRVRPLLMVVMFRALGKESTDAVCSLAAAFQLIHTASLVHDDVIDHAEMRRGRPSMPRAFGLPTAIVTGDYLFVRAFELAAEYPRSIILRCGESCADLVEGEVLEDTAKFDLTTGIEHYFRVVERKTAAILAAGVASVAEIAGATPAVVDAVTTFGKSLGIAFQIQDDLLDVFGDPDLLGKPLYSDLREGNPTLVALEAYALLDGARRAEFERLFALHRKTPGDLLRLKALAEESGARAKVAREAERWGEMGVRSLDILAPSPYRALLSALARGAAVRRF